MIKKRSLATYTVAHFVVDFSCFYILMGIFSKSVEGINNITLGFLLYNVIAFGLQMFIGCFSDIYQVKPFKLAGLGILTVLGALLPGRLLFPWAALILCAAGNAFFHIGGGTDSLLHANGRVSRCGVFVSSGALGVVLGTVAGRSDISFAVPALALAVCAGTVYLICRGESSIERPMNVKSGNQPANNTVSKLTNSKPGSSIGIHLPEFNIGLKSVKTVIYLCLMSIVIRSFVGSEIPIEWKTNTVFFILPGICAFTGKFAGGFLADKFGAKNIGVLSLLVSIPLLSIFYNHIALCLLGLILFNMTMSITLWGVAVQLPEQPGFAFGLTTFALLAGNVPTFFFKASETSAPVILSFLTVCSAACIFIAVNNKRGEKYYDSRNDFLSKKLPT